MRTRRFSGTLVEGIALTAPAVSTAEAANWRSPTAMFVKY
jgi:hypothetical protein